MHTEDALEHLCDDMIICAKSRVDTLDADVLRAKLEYDAAKDKSMMLPRMAGVWRHPKAPCSGPGGDRYAADQAGCIESRAHSK